MTIAELAQDRAELLLRTQRRPPTKAECQKRLAAVRHARRKYGASCTIPVGAEEQLEGFLAEYPPGVTAVSPEPPAPVVVAPTMPDDVRTITWLKRSVLIGVRSRLKVVGYDSAIGAPAWLEEHLAAKAAG